MPILHEELYTQYKKQFKQKTQHNLYPTKILKREYQ